MNGMFILVIMAVFFFFGALSQRSQILQSPTTSKELIAQRALQPVLAIAEDVPPNHAVQELKKRGYLLALVRSMKGRILGIIDLKTLEACSDAMLTQLPLEGVESIYLDDEKTLSQVPRGGWLVVFDEYNVLLGATPAVR